MRIMTHNIWGDYFKNPVEGRADGAFAIYQQYAPDVIGFQELTKSWNESELFERLSENYRFVGLDRFFANCYVPIAYKKNLTLLSFGFERFENVPDTSKSLCWAVFKNESGKSFGVCNAHFWFMSGFEPEEKKQGIARGFGEIAFFTNEQHKNVRAENARQMIARMKKISKEYSCPVFGLGDMNCTRQSRVFDVVCQNEGVKYLYDFAKERDDICSIHGYPLSDGEGKWHGSMPNRDHMWSIDHIFAWGEAIDVQSYRVVTDQNALDVSDHSPVFTDVWFS